jgi:hypothetical protein
MCSDDDYSLLTITGTISLAIIAVYLQTKPFFDPDSDSSLSTKSWSKSSKSDDDYFALKVLKKPGMCRFINGVSI